MSVRRPSWHVRSPDCSSSSPSRSPSRGRNRSIGSTWPRVFDRGSGTPAATGEQRVDWSATDAADGMHLLMTGFPIIGTALATIDTPVVDAGGERQILLVAVRSVRVVPDGRVGAKVAWGRMMTEDRGIVGRVSATTSVASSRAACHSDTMRHRLVVRVWSASFRRSVRRAIRISTHARNARGASHAAIVEESSGRKPLQRGCVAWRLSISGFWRM
ncbi:MAG: hypothetical protein QOF01_4609 [Thermomicrobiales bacterium]|jgi:hypothetical protein|nr:hypothetical protein [Thermomicrobiales bacterium]